MNGRQWIITFGESRRVYYTRYHAEQLCRALRLNGTAYQMTEPEESE